MPVTDEKSTDESKAVGGKIAGLTNPKPAVVGKPTVQLLKAAPGGCRWFAD